MLDFLIVLVHSTISADGPFFRAGHISMNTHLNVELRLLSVTHLVQTNIMADCFTNIKNISFTIKNNEKASNCL